MCIPETTPELYTARLDLHQVTERTLKPIQKSLLSVLKGMDRVYRLV